MELTVECCKHTIKHRGGRGYFFSSGVDGLVFTDDMMNSDYLGYLEAFWMQKSVKE